MAARVISLPGIAPEVSDDLPCPRQFAGETLKQDFEAVLSEPVPERFGVLIRKLREQEMRRSALIASEHHLDKS
ncbi:MAG: NepR family anti-sigma factor [Hyphomonas sp.]